MTIYIFIVGQGYRILRRENKSDFNSLGAAILCSNDNFRVIITNCTLLLLCHMVRLKEKCT